jgi:hypothetical protein
VEVDCIASEHDMQLPCITITNSDEEDEEEEQVVATEVTDDVSKCETYLTTATAPDEHEETKALSSIQLPLPFKVRFTFDIFQKKSHISIKLYIKN